MQQACQLWSLFQWLLAFTRAQEEQALALFPFLSVLTTGLFCFALMHSKASLPRPASVTSRAFLAPQALMLCCWNWRTGYLRGIWGHAGFVLLLTSCAPPRPK